MSREFAKFAFTPEVKTMQERYDSRQMYEKFVEKGPANNKLGAKEITLITNQDSFYMGSVGSNGWPYIQFRGGKKGFLKVLDEETLGFADFQGNLQYISVGNFSSDNRVFLFLMDYSNRRRLKIWGNAQVFHNNQEILQQVVDSDYSAEVGRAILIKVKAWDWNCPQHIPIKYSEADVAQMMAPLEARIKELEAQLKNISGNE